MLPNALALPQLQFEKHARARAGAAFAPRCRKKPKPVAFRRASTNTGPAQEFSKPQFLPSAMPAKRKSPALPGFDE